MKPTTPPELASNQSLLAEISIIAAKKAMESAKINASEIDAVIMVRLIRQETIQPLQLKSKKSWV